MYMSSLPYFKIALAFSLFSSAAFSICLKEMTVEEATKRTCQRFEEGDSYCKAPLKAYITKGCLTGTLPGEVTNPSPTPNPNPPVSNQTKIIKLSADSDLSPNAIIKYKKLMLAKNSYHLMASFEMDNTVFKINLNRSKDMELDYIYDMTITWGQRETPIQLNFAFDPTDGLWFTEQKALQKVWVVPFSYHDIIHELAKTHDATFAMKYLISKIASDYHELQSSANLATSENNFFKLLSEN